MTHKYFHDDTESPRNVPDSKSVGLSKVCLHGTDTIEQAETVFVKPNVVSDEPYPTTTDPQVLDVVLTFLSSHRVVAGDGPAYDYSWRLAHF